MNRLIPALMTIALTSGWAAAQELEIGKPAPDFTVTGIDGKEFKLSDITGSGKHVGLMFSRANW